jgi:hypothetical protein
VPKKKSVSLEVGDPNVELPFETAELRKGLDAFLNTPISYPKLGLKDRRVGDFRWGVYAFYDFDGEPIYVGQTNESLRVRIRRHLTNQRTDAVAMSVLDPFEVCEVQVWPLPEYETVKNDKDLRWKTARSHLNAVEYLVFQQLLADSHFHAVLNEKVPTKAAEADSRKVPTLHLRQRVVSEAVSALRDHPDLRIARRAATLARLAKIISERKVQKGLRVVLHTQSRRLEALAKKRIPVAVDLTPEEDDAAQEEGKSDPE